MRILLLGATGRSGTIILSEALGRNHSVTALVRNPSKSSIQPQSGLQVVQGTPLSQADIESALAATPTPPSAIIVALASVRETDSPFSKSTSPPNLMNESHKNVVAALRKLGLEQKVMVVTMQAFGTGSSSEAVWWPMRKVLRNSGMSVAMADHDKVVEVMKEAAKEGNGIRWTGVRACMLKGEERNEVKVFEEGVGDGWKGLGFMPSVSRASVAKFMVDVVEDESGKWTGRTPVISN
jgi:nucleoside-diphosphate-sugar epimerase